MLKNKGFEVILASPPEYNKLVAEVYFDGKFVAVVSQERSDGAFQVETPGPELVQSQLTHSVELRGFIATLELAAERLST